MELLAIDGSHLEGGGQIVRTAVALSAITGQGVRIFNIRKGREKPGLKPQHLEGIKAAVRMCHAEHEGLSSNSMEVVFVPGKIEGGAQTIDTKTAGAITLVLQTIVPIALYAESPVRLIVRGGTAVPFSPTIEYFERVVGFYLRRAGLPISLETRKHGFYPAGGGEVLVRIEPGALHGIDLVERGALQKIEVLAIASGHLRGSRVAERLLDGFRKSFPGAHMKYHYVDADSPGCFIAGYAEFEHCRLGASNLGQRGVPAQNIGQEAGNELRQAIDGAGVVDSWMVDQLIPYLALAAASTKNPSRLRIPELSQHARTNMWVIQQFLPVQFDNRDNVLTCSLKT